MTSCWKIELLVGPGEGERFAAALEAQFEILQWRAEGPAERVVGHGVAAPGEARVAAALAAVAGELGSAPPVYEIVVLPDIDWLAENQKSFPPLAIGGFFVHDREHRPARGHRLRATRPAAVEIDAGPAFGTGTHATTAGCLLALDRLARQQLRPGPILDMGCGSGILTVAAAKIFTNPVIASDIDPIAVRTTTANARRNGLGGRVYTTVSVGYGRLGRSGPYALILANILAGPLAAMAADLDRHLKPGGRAVLSGLLVGQENQVLVPHLARGLRLEARLVIDDWATLVIAKPAA